MFVFIMPLHWGEVQINVSSLSGGQDTGRVIVGSESGRVISGSGSSRVIKGSG